jgi:hypothetical protein
MKRKISKKTASMPRSSILDIHIRILVRRHRRAKMGLDPSGPGPSFRFSLCQVLEGSRDLAQEQLGQRQEPSWNQLLRDLKDFGKSLKKLPAGGKIEMLAAGNKSNESFRRIHHGQAGQLGHKAAKRLARRFPKHEKSRSA